MATKLSLRPAAINGILILSLLSLVLVPAISASAGIHTNKDLVDASQLAKKSLLVMDEDISKKSRAPLPGSAMVPPGLHFFPLLGAFFIVLLIVFENEAKSRQLLVLPLAFAFILYKVLFLIEENAAMDRVLGRR